MLTRVSPGSEPHGFGAALISALENPACEAIVVTPEGASPVPEARLVSLLSTGYGIGAVVPQVRHPDGRLLEAGTVTASGRPASRHTLSDDPAVVHTAADVDGSRHPWLAFRRQILAGSLTDASVTPAGAAQRVLAAVREAGLRTVYEPSWTVTSAGPAEVATPGGPDPDGRCASRVLVVTPFLADGTARCDDAFAGALIDDLVSVADPATVTVAVLDGFGSGPAARRLGALGAEVVSAPLDWDRWFAARWGSFDQVLVLRSAVSGALMGRLATTQPQAVPILCVDALPFRAVEQLRPVTPPDEAAGLDYFADTSAATVHGWLQQFRAVLCCRSDDAAYLRSMVRGVPVVQIPPALPPGAPGEPLERREGIAIVAANGYDSGSGSEDSVRAALDSVVAILRHRHRSLPLTVLSDPPSPLLRRLAGEQGFELVGMELAPRVLGRVRLVLAVHPFGTGGAAAVAAAIGARVPFVASEAAVQGLELGSARNLTVFGDPSDVYSRANRLIVDDDYWHSVRDAIDQLARRAYDTQLRRDGLRSLLAGTGWFATREPRRWPAPEAPEGPSGPPARRPLPAIRPDMRPTVTLGPAPRPDSFELDAGERYRLWHERHGPGPGVLRVMQQELARLSYRPLISVVMPVYNTDPRLLRQAVGSVRDQLYENWELCIGDDASSRADTSQLVDELASDARVRVARLAENSGISAATNAALALVRGEFVAFMDHDDLLKPHALAQVARWLDADPGLDVVYTDEDKVDDDGELSDPHLKPDWSPDLLMSMNYVSHLTVVRRELVERVGGLRADFDGSQDYDLLLRVDELTDRIAHIPEPLYSWRKTEGSAAADPWAKPYAASAAKRALAEALQRRGTPGRIEDTRFPTFYRTRYAIPGRPKVSIVIPTRDGIDLLRACIQSVLEKSTYENFDIVVVDNQSREGETLEYLANSPVRVLRYPHRFNYSRQMNLAAAWAESEVLVFLNNDTEVITPGWIEALLEHAMRPEVGAVGARLFYGDGRVQHEGIVIGSAGGLAWNVDTGGYFARGDVVRNVSAVTGACVMMRSTVYARVGGNDERLRIAYNDVDICMRVRQAGLRVVYTPYAELFHYEGATRKGAEDDVDGPLFAERWQITRCWDPYHSPLFLNTRTDTAFLLAI